MNIGGGGGKVGFNMEFSCTICPPLFCTSSWAVDFGRCLRLTGRKIEIVPHSDQHLLALKYAFHQKRKTLKLRNAKPKINISIRRAIISLTVLQEENLKPSHHRVSNCSYHNKQIGKNLAKQRREQKVTSCETQTRICLSCL